MSAPDTKALLDARRRRRAWTIVSIAAWIVYIPLHAIDFPLAPIVFGLAATAMFRAAAWYGWLAAHAGGTP